MARFPNSHKTGGYLFLRLITPVNYLGQVKFKFLSPSWKLKLLAVIIFFSSYFLTFYIFQATTEGLSKPSDLDEVKALNEKVLSFDKTCLNYLKVLDAANAASQKMTTHTEADAEVAALKERYAKVKAVSDTWVKKCEVLVKEWTLLDNTVTELNSWVAKDKSAEGENQFSLEKMESTLGELKNIFKQKEKLVEDL